MVMHVPAVLPSNDPFLQTEISPACVLQLYFPAIAEMESALRDDGPLSLLMDHERFPVLAGCTWTQQAMAVRQFAVAAAVPINAIASNERFTYLVAYDGHAANDDAWLAQYIKQHPPIMAKLPGVREIEVYTRIDYCSYLPAARATALQRNKVVFDTASALAHALNSPVRHALREDFESLPLFTGVAPHYPMRTVIPCL